MEEEEEEEQSLFYEITFNSTSDKESEVCRFRHFRRHERKKNAPLPRKGISERRELVGEMRAFRSLKRTNNGNKIVDYCYSDYIYIATIGHKLLMQLSEVFGNIQ